MFPTSLEDNSFFQAPETVTLVMTVIETASYLLLYIQPPLYLSVAKWLSSDQGDVSNDKWHL